MVADPGKLDLRRGIAAVAALATMLALVAVGVRSVSAAASAPNGPVAFVSDRDGDPEIFVLNPDGGGAQRLTDNEAWDTDPAWSPDATRIAISSGRDGDDDVYVVDATGTGSALNLTDAGTGRDTQPDWSPNGKRIVFVRDGDVHVVPLAGGTPVRLVRGHDPAWSPDGTSIAFVRSGNILVMEPDGSGVETVVQDADPFGLDWSPDGARLVFAANGLTDDGGYHIFVIAGDGSGLRALTDDAIAEDFSPAFSPDGSKVVFTRIALDANVMTVNLDGTGLAALVDDPAYDFEPHWGTCTGTACPTPTPSATSTTSPSPDPTPSASPTGTRLPSTLTLSAIKGRERVRAAGRLRPAHEGAVTVKLQKRKGRWVTLRSKEVALDGEGGYRARFRRPRRGTACRLVARWAGDDDHLGSVARQRFRC